MDCRRPTYISGKSCCSWWFQFNNNNNSMNNKLVCPVKLVKAGCYSMFGHLIHGQTPTLNTIPSLPHTLLPKIVHMLLLTGPDNNFIEIQLDWDCWYFLYSCQLSCVAEILILALDPTKQLTQFVRCTSSSSYYQKINKQITPKWILRTAFLQAGSNLPAARIYFLILASWLALFWSWEKATLKNIGNIAHSATAFSQHSLHSGSVVLAGPI